jgi:hypothetical protein
MSGGRTWGDAGPAGNGHTRRRVAAPAGESYFSVISVLELTT